MDLSKVELFRAFKPDEIEKFRSVIEKMSLKDGDVLFNEGDPGDALYIIQGGAIRIYKTIDAGTGEEKSLALLDAGTYMGEMSLMDGTPRSASARAEGDSVVLRITRTNFINLIKGYPQAAIRLFVSFMNVLSERLRNTNDELVVLYEVGKIISAAPPVNETLGGILMLLKNAVKAKTAAVFVINEFTEMLEAQEVLGENAPELAEIKPKKNEGVLGLAIQKDELLRLSDFDTDAEYAGVKRLGFEKPEMLVAPLSHGSVPFGALVLLEREDGEPFSNANVNLVSAVASQASAGIQTALTRKDKAAREEFNRMHIHF